MLVKAAPTWYLARGAQPNAGRDISRPPGMPPLPGHGRLSYLARDLGTHPGRRILMLATGTSTPGSPGSSPPCPRRANGI